MRPQVDVMAPAAETVAGTDAAQLPADGTARPEGEGSGQRERRSRDRYGRDRRERGERGERQERPSQEEAATGSPVNAAPEARNESRPAPVAAASAAAATPSRELPRVQPYALPVGDLNQVASAAGLQWVNSDAGKVAAVQAAIAAEPKPVHVPRERPAPVVIDEGPLVLVETRKDLSQIRLPFDGTAS